LDSVEFPTERYNDGGSSKRSGSELWPSGSPSIFGLRIAGQFFFLPIEMYDEIDTGPPDVICALVDRREYTGKIHILRRDPSRFSEAFWLVRIDYDEHPGEICYRTRVRTISDPWEDGDLEVAQASC
jgi:hypothetical protein